jgi:hypothetical protein
MSNVTFYDSSVDLLAAQADAVGRLAQDSGAFAAVVAAFESQDPDAFRWVLQRLEILERCELICVWVRIKMCVLRCVEVCGSPDPKAPQPELAQFAQAVTRLASNETLLRRVVDAVSCGDAHSFHTALAELHLSAFCHLLCRWVCSIIYRRICEIVCGPRPLVLTDAVSEIRAGAAVLARVVANEKAFAAIGEAATRLDCELLRTTIGQAGFAGDCEIICHLVCNWRCGWVCRTLCVESLPILTGTYAVEEARNFALATRQLASQPRALRDLVSAVQNRDVEAYHAIVTRFALAPYCAQVCSWVCSAMCFEFCACVCPNPALQPLFTNIGHFDIYTDIDPVSGKTNKGLLFPGLSHSGGPNFAFYSQLQFSGFCPTTSPAFPGVGMKYRFLYAISSGPQTPITDNLVSTVQAATRAVSWPTQSGANTAVLPMLTLHLPVMVWGPSSSQPIMPPDPVAPALGAPYVAPAAFYIAPDPSGWVTVDPAVDGAGFSTLMGFDTTQVTPGPNPAPGVPAGTAVPAAAQRMGTDISITFEATRVTTFPPGTTADYTQPAVKIHVNNYNEVNELNFLQFMGTGNCCTPIDATLTVQFTVDHEEMDSGAWSLSITSCSESAPGDITPPSHATTLAAAITAAQTSIIVTSSTGFPAAPFDVSLGSTGEIMKVTAVAATTWTVARGQAGTPATAAAVGAMVSTILPAVVAATVTARGGSGTVTENTSEWLACSYIVWLNTRPGLTSGLIDRPASPNLLPFCICGH